MGTTRWNDWPGTTAGWGGGRRSWSRALLRLRTMGSPGVDDDGCTDTRKRARVRPPAWPSSRGELGVSLPWTSISFAAQGRRALHTAAPMETQERPRKAHWPSYDFSSKVTPLSPPFRSEVGRPASFHPFFRATVDELGFLSSPTGPSPGIQAKAWCPSRPPSHGKASMRRRGPRRRDGCTCVISEQQWLTFSKPMAAAFSLKHWRQMSI